MRAGPWHGMFGSVTAARDAIAAEDDDSQADSENQTVAAMMRGGAEATTKGISQEIWQW